MIAVGDDVTAFRRFSVGRRRRSAFAEIAPDSENDPLWRIALERRNHLLAEIASADGLS
jgi:hypothetical protein